MNYLSCKLKTLKHANQTKLNNTAEIELLQGLAGKLMPSSNDRRATLQLKAFI